MTRRNMQPCPECESGMRSDESRVLGASRRDFLRTAGALAAGTAIFPAWARGAEASDSAPETMVKELFQSMSADQKKTLCFPFDAKLRSEVQANWDITEPKIEDLTLAQQDMVESIVRGLCSEEGYEKFETQMGDDAGGLGQYHIAIFGEPGASKFEFVLTGRHVTMRADGNSVDKVAFGGPMVYGHAHASFNEPANHNGNVFWYQGVRANEVFSALDPKQREIALIAEAPEESKIEHRSAGYDGIEVGQLSSDQKELVQKVMSDLLSPYRKEDADEVMSILTANGGLDRIHLAFYKTDDIGNDGVWDIWRLEGPGFVWHFRGAPHVHTWVNIAEV